jgi:Holliday junction resolvase RusA-like endonuclease
MKINIKPLSVNEAWQGRRFKTKKYKKYECDLIGLLPDLEIPDGELFIDITWGFSNKRSDIDNPAKMFIDCLQKKYQFNDSRIFKLTMTKKITKKGNEFVSFIIMNYNETESKI